MRYLSSFAPARAILAGVVTALILLTGGCDSGLPSDEAERSPTSSDVRKRNLSPVPQHMLNLRTLDDELADMAEQAEGFGGMFYDEHGVLSIYMKNPGNDVIALSAVRAVRGEEALSKSAGPVNILQGQYDFRDLKAWRDKLREKMRIAGVIALDLDEAKNRVWIGVKNQSVIDQVRALLAKLGIPQEAVLIEVTEPVQPPFEYADDHDEEALPPPSRPQQENLRGYVRPLRGGLKITGEDGFGDNLPSCTLGVISELDGFTGFLTNSHCTEILFLNDNTRYHQPTAFNPVGTEYQDAQAYTGSCTTGYCAYADAAFVITDAGVSTDLGYIARPESMGSGSTVISVSQPKFKITSVWYTYVIQAPAVGETVYKVGQRTGWESGSITRSCYDPIHFKDPTVTMFCQYQASAPTVEGDSGGPVFYGTGTNVRLDGIVWGRDGTDAVFSWFPYIRQEFTGHFAGANYLPVKAPF